MPGRVDVDVVYDEMTALLDTLVLQINSAAEPYLDRSRPSLARMEEVPVETVLYDLTGLQAYVKRPDGRWNGESGPWLSSHLFVALSATDSHFYILREGSK